MRTRTAGAGLGLLASAPVCLLGTWEGTAPCGLWWSAGAWLAVAAAALAYRDVAAHGRRALPAAAMALLGVVASAGTVEATLRAAGEHLLAGQPGLLLALVCGAAAGVAGLAWAGGRAGLVPPPAAVLATAATLLSTLTADPAAPYLLGAGPLGAVLLVEALRPGARKGQAT
ncbi:hypothetical protein MF672_021205 [Actinomadura sp. ATCC 31491]|uniref:Metal-dependent phosphohydrolase n=1 Tax=Actinomadura luzonensis TaxID=2805427 RepID=A0ABT0FWI4_9ACTN|nr:hypothetical protein [Actinomadura luzonensis]MCK2216300.1 hypothetical protein [Actinomadura luzonensis]